MAVVELPAAAREILARIADREPGRREAVEREMHQYLNGGFEYKRAVLRGSAERLEAKARQVLVADNRERKASLWPYTCSKLADVSDGSAPGAREAATTASEIARDHAVTADELAHAEHWLNEHATVAKEIDLQLAADGCSTANPWGELARRGRLLVAWRAAGSPKRPTD